MKTHKVKPILIEVNNSFLYLHEGKLYNNKITMHIPDGKQVPQQLILISLEDEKIEVGDLFINEQLEGGFALWKHNGEVEPNSNPKKVIATQDQLSPKLIQQLVDEYNTGGIQDFEIEMEEIDSEEYHAEINYFGKTDIELKFESKLTNGFITVAKVDEPIFYTKKDLEKAFNAGYERGYEASPVAPDEFENPNFEDWFNQNKKK